MANSLCHQVSFTKLKMLRYISSLTLVAMLRLCHGQRYLACSPGTDRCPSYAHCVDAGAKGHICLCRAYHRFSNLTWPKGCNETFAPVGISVKEKGDVASPDYIYSMIPQKMFNFSRHVGASNTKSVRLHQSSTWCAPADAVKDYVTVDLGVLSNISMIATQGNGENPILKYVEQFIMEYSIDGTNWVNVTSDGTGIGPAQVFNGNSGPTNNDVAYNVFNHKIRGRFFKVKIIKEKLQKCLRIELYGQREMNECKSKDWNICHVNAVCKELFAAYKCHCLPGYADFLGNGELCLDNDECLQSTHNCSSYATCTNKPGSFVCQCKNGYHGDGYYCEDIDECKSNPCIPDAFCTNLNPFYRCTCKSGYAGDGNTCTDIDECSNGMNNCHRSRARCLNTIGSYVCTCKTGYTGNGQQCEDVNECTLGTHNCHRFAKCTNYIGGFNCDCVKPGFNGDGLFCYDIDECSYGPTVHQCKSNERCYNLIGSYKCQCPKELPMQPRYIDSETTLFGNLADELSKISEEESDDPLDDYAQKIRKIYQMSQEVYNYHYQETVNSFYTVHIAGNKFAFEMYDFRCSDVKKLFFPNHCHSNYVNVKFWSTITDQVDIQFVGENEIPFEQWATPGPTTGPTTTLAQTTSANMTNITTTSAPRNVTSTPAPVNWNGGLCRTKKFNGSRGIISSPRFPDHYPLNIVCRYLIELPGRRNVYINFTFFELEKDRKCVYDNVRIYDGKSESDRLIARYCGNDGLPLPVRSSGPNMLVVFRSDSRFVMRGFNATWAALEPRVSVGCMIFNPISYTSDSRLHTKYLARMFETDRSKFVPISRMLACKQYPQCNVSMPRPMEFTFEHTITDSSEKECIHWNIDVYGSTWSKTACTLGLTNKTHTVCKCWPYGIVAVIGRDRPYYPPEKAIIAFNLGKNCLMSLILVVLTLIGTLLYLFFKDNWIPYFMTILRDKDYDSGRIIQMHVVLNVLLTEMFFSVITFGMTASAGSCFFMAFVFYYLLQTVFFWLFIYTLFLQSRITPIFDSTKYNTYKIYLAMGYGIPFLVTLTVTGLKFKMETNERMCWILFNGTTVWGYSCSVCTLALGSIALLMVTMYNANGLEDGILLQEKCLKNMFTTVFCLFAAAFGARAVETGNYSAQYLFSLFNLLLCYSITLIYCILTREQPMVQTNKVAPSEESGEISALGMLAEIAMTKYQKEKGADLDEMFGAENSSTPRKRSSFKNLADEDYDFGSREELEMVSQGEDSESDEDREDGRIHFRFDEYQQMQKSEQETNIDSPDT